MLKFGINGFGRIGRLTMRYLIENPSRGQVVTINNPGLSLEEIKYLLIHDTCHGNLNKKKNLNVKTEGNSLIVNNQQVLVTHEVEPKNINWHTNNVNIVFDCTGKFLNKKSLEDHLLKGVEKIIISAPPKDPEIPLFVYGVNHLKYRENMNIISNASCTTNCLAPIVKVIHDNFVLEKGLMSTIHSVTMSQNCVDGHNKKNFRIGRSCLNNIIPSTTGAAKSVGKIFPELQGKITGMAFRVPVNNVSVVDLVFRTKKKTNYEEICKKMKEVSEGDMKGILGYTEDMVVSTDFMSDERSAVFDKNAGMGLGDDFFKVVAWYDNEYGYAVRMVDLANFIMV